MKGAKNLLKLINAWFVPLLTLEILEIQVDGNSEMMIGEDYLSSVPVYNKAGQMLLASANRIFFAKELAEKFLEDKILELY